MPAIDRKERDQKMQRAAFFMARFREPNGKNGSPPAEMGVSNWPAAYRRLYQELGGGRRRETFCGSIAQDRQHYVDCIEQRENRRNKLSDKRLKTLDYWLYRSREKLWVEFCEWMK